MPSSLSNEKLRQIAVLVASVDRTAASKLLMHLPTETAKLVRQMARELGTVSDNEKRAVLAEFQRSAALGGRGSTGAEVPASTNLAEVGAATSSTSPPQLTSGSTHGQSSEPEATGWKALSIEALGKFIEDERTTVVAVVVSQLPAAKGAQLLSRLPQDRAIGVLEQLSKMAEIDDEAMQAIDEHLSTSLEEFQQRFETERENAERLKALLAAATPEVRQQWQAISGVSQPAVEAAMPRGQETVQAKPATAKPGAAQPSTNNAGLENTETSRTPANVENVKEATRAEPVHWGAFSTSHEATVDELYQDAVITTQAGQGSEAIGGQSSSNTSPTDQANHGDSPVILRFPGQDESALSSSQKSFEKIADLPVDLLAELLSNVDSQVVLHALAGATPSFMGRFYKMLEPQDARMLKQRLQKLGSMRLRDVDQAQRKLSQAADKYFKNVLQKTTQQKVA